VGLRSAAAVVLFLLGGAAATLAAAGAIAIPSRASTATCGEGTYAYAGMRSRERASGVAATITPIAFPQVRDGHVGGWVGVGGIGLGPNGADEWIQIGLTAVPNANNVIYYEIVRPHHRDVFRELRHDIPVGAHHRFAVRELAARPNWWRVWLDGVPASPPVFLPSSHAHWTAQAFGESWAGMTSGACNAYAYAFSDVAVAGVRGGEWKPFRGFRRFQGPGYRLRLLSAVAFVVSDR